MKILLFTATGAENLGDELITLMEIQHLQRRHSDTYITLFSHDILRAKRFLISQNISLEKVQIQEYFPNYLRQKPFKNIKLFWKTLVAIKNTDHIYIGGGGLLYGKNEEGQSPLRLWSMRVRLAKFFKKPTTYLSLGISATIDELKPFSKTLFAGTEITVRDRKSQEILSQFGFEATLLPDPVLTYTPDRGDETKAIGVALRRGYLEDSKLTEILKKLTGLGYEMLFLPHSLHPTDEQSHDGYYLQDFLFPGISTTQTIEQTLEGYKKCHIILSMRLHSMILAVDHHIPFIGISYGQKTGELLRDLDWKYSHENDVTATEILRNIDEIESHYAELQEKLTTKHEEYKAQYSKLFPGT